MKYSPIRTVKQAEARFKYLSSPGAWLEIPHTEDELGHLWQALYYAQETGDVDYFDQMDRAISARPLQPIIRMKQAWRKAAKKAQRLPVKWKQRAKRAGEKLIRAEDIIKATHRKR